MAEKTIRVAVWEYLNAEGRRRLAYFGDTVEIPESEIAKGELVDAFGIDSVEPDDVQEAEPEPATTPVEVEPPAPAPSTAGDRPKNAAPKPIWEAYALKRGIENAADLNKDELVAAVNALDAK